MLRLLFVGCGGQTHDPAASGDRPGDFRPGCASIRHMRPRGRRPLGGEATRILERLIAGTLWWACHPDTRRGPSVATMDAWTVLVGGASFMTDAAPLPAQLMRDGVVPIDAVGLVAALFDQEGSALVRLVRLFVDDRNAAEDLVQEAFIRLARSAHRIRDPAKAPAYLRSIVLNLARDHNRRGLVSLRHHLPLDDARASFEDEIELRDVQRQVIDALRALPRRQRDCLVLRYYEELGIEEVAATLGISPNSVKTHLKRGLRALEARLAEAGVDLTVAAEAS
jgi:RNA polymerase sigma-70 factor (sigma-E family)